MDWVLPVYMLGPRHWQGSREVIVMDIALNILFVFLAICFLVGFIEVMSGIVEFLVLILKCIWRFLGEE